MAQLRWLLTCQRIITDRETNFVSYVDAVEGVAVPQLPHPMPPFMVATLWDREHHGESIVARVRIMDPDGELVTSLGPIELQHNEALRHRANVSVFLSRITKVGTYTVAVDQNVNSKWREERTVPLDVELQANATVIEDAPKPPVNVNPARNAPRRRRRSAE